MYTYVRGEYWAHAVYKVTLPEAIHHNDCLLNPTIRQTDVHSEHIQLAEYSIPVQNDNTQEGD
jgi:hypothetical protein